MTETRSPAGTFLFTANRFGGQGGVWTYDGDIERPVSGILDYPRFANLSSIDLLLPASSLGYGMSAGLWVEDWHTLEDYNLTALGTVSAYIGQPPRARYLYTIDLRDPAFQDVSGRHRVTPSAVIPWDVPLVGGNLYRISKDVLLEIAWGPASDNYLFFDVPTGLWKSFTVPGWNVVWAGRTRGYLDLLLQDDGAYPATRIIANRVDLAAASDVGSLTGSPVTTLWQRNFSRQLSNYFAIPFVRGGLVEVFEGTWGLPPSEAGFVDVVNAYEFETGATVWSSEDDIAIPASGPGVWPINYPASAIQSFTGKFLLDFERNLSFEFPADDVMLFAEQRSGREHCGSCITSVFVTRYQYPEIGLLVESYDWLNDTTDLDSLNVLIDPARLLPPEARLDHMPAVASVGAPVLFDAGGSSSPNETISSYTWDFGNGETGSGLRVNHTYRSPGTFAVRLTLATRSRQSASAAATVVVVEPPLAVVTISQRWPFSGETVTFDASSSSSPNGEIVDYSWEFGDGSSASGKTVQHRYATNGSYVATLALKDVLGGQARTTRLMQVSKAVDLVSISHRDFRLLLPSDWEIDLDPKDVHVDLVALGPVSGGVRTNIVLVSESASVREDPASLESVVQGVLTELRREKPSAYLAEQPEQRRVAGHGAISFLIGYSSDPSIRQKGVIVASEAHGRLWLLVLTADTQDFGPEESIFEHAVGSFEITSIAAGPLWILAGIGIAAGSALVVVIVFMRRRSRKRSTQTPRFCPKCGTQVSPPGRFCGRCGGFLGGPPAAGPPRPPP